MSETTKEPDEAKQKNESSRCRWGVASGIDDGRGLSTRNRSNVGGGERRDGEEGRDGKGEHDGESERKEEGGDAVER